jgi:hypothetical protein
VLLLLCLCLCLHDRVDLNMCDMYHSEDLGVSWGQDLYFICVEA